MIAMGNSDTSAIRDIRDIDSFLTDQGIGALTPLGAMPELDGGAQVLDRGDIDSFLTDQAIGALTTLGAMPELDRGAQVLDRGAQSVDRDFEDLMLYLGFHSDVVSSEYGDAIDYVSASEYVGAIGGATQSSVRLRF